MIEGERDLECIWARTIGNPAIIQVYRKGRRVVSVEGYEADARIGIGREYEYQTLD